MATEFYLKIDGTDVTKLIAAKGVKWTRQDVDASTAGRTMDGVMQRARVATKVRLDIKCAPLTTAQMQMVQKLIEPEFVTVEYLDVREGKVTKTMYSNNFSTEMVLTQIDGKHYWGEFTFPLIER